MNGKCDILELTNYGILWDADQGGASGAPAAGQGDNSGDPPDANTPDKKSPATPATGQGQQPGESSEGQPKSGDSEPIMSQAALDKRLAKQARATQRELLRGLGVEIDDDADQEAITAASGQLADTLKWADDQRRSGQSAQDKVQEDLENAQKAAKSEKTKRENAEQERDTAQQQLRDFVLRNAISTAAHDAAHPSDVYDAYAQVHMKDKLAQVIKTDTPLFGEDNAFNAAAIDQDVVKTIIDKCREDRPEWWTTRVQLGSPSNVGAKPLQGDRSKLDQMKELARDNLRRI